jgi:hypothetical protein
MVTGQKTRPPQNRKPSQEGKSPRDIAIIVAAVAAVLIAVSIVLHVVRSNEPNIIYHPIPGASAKAQWVKEHQNSRSAP